MADSKTVFYLAPWNPYADDIVQDPANRSRICFDPDVANRVVLRFGLDQTPRSPPHLATFGRRSHNDVILNNRFSRNDQCYFNFNKDTGELLLHDISVRGDTQLYEVIYEGGQGDRKNKPIRRGQPQIWKTPRQCTVLLGYDHYNDCGHEWILKMGGAMFRLLPRKTQGQDEAIFTGEKLAFAGQPDPDQTSEETAQGHMARGRRTEAEALTTTYRSLSTVSTYNTPLEPTDDEVIRYTKLRPLGNGGQGEVHEVVDMYNGNHYACKLVAVKEVPTQNIFSERDFRAKIEKEVNLVRRVQHHENIVGYDYCQGFRTGSNIEIFMPIYDGSLHGLIRQYRSRLSATELHDGSTRAPQAIRDMTDRMLRDILDALKFVHTHNPPIIHRDIKPANILYQGMWGDKFLLTDFGIAKVVDASRTLIGSRGYVAPEVVQGREQTSMVDIYSLGATIVDCLVNTPQEREHQLKTHGLWQWHGYLQARLQEHAPQYAAMLATDANQRPTAHQLLKTLGERLTHGPLQNWQANFTRTDFGASPIMYQGDPTPMDWTRP